MTQNKVLDLADCWFYFFFVFGKMVCAGLRFALDKSIRLETRMENKMRFHPSKPGFNLARNSLHKLQTIEGIYE